MSKMKNFFLFCLLCSSFFSSLNAEEKKLLKVLHLTFHKGCMKEFQAVADTLSLDVTTWFIPDLPAGWLDGKTQGNALYNIGHERAENIWMLHHQEFETFDVIVTSDTAPLARVFLQNGWNKPLVIWICNRFDYCDKGSLDCEFPDQEYYELFQGARNKGNVKIVAYTQFEHAYARSKGVNTGELTITPSGIYQDAFTNSAITSVDKSKTFFLPPYHNEKNFMDLSRKCNHLGIKNYCGRYNGPKDLKDFKGIIHIPYAWSNLAFFENISEGIVYFVPSKKFLKELVKQGAWFQDQSFLIQNKGFELSEWYCPQHQNIIVYFDSWKDLKKKVRQTDFKAMKHKIETYAKQNRQSVISNWRMVFNEFNKIQ